VTTYHWQQERDGRNRTEVTARTRIAVYLPPTTGETDLGIEVRILLTA